MDDENKQSMIMKSPGHAFAKWWYNGQYHQSEYCFGPHCIAKACPVLEEKNKDDTKPQDESDVQGEEAKRHGHHHGGSATTKRVCKPPKASRAKPKAANKAM